MEIQIFDRDINFLGIVENYNSLRWLDKYANIGEFELIAEYTEDNINFLKEGNIVYKTDGDTAGFIDYIYIKDNTIQVRGMLTSRILETRIILNTSYIREIEPDVRTIVATNCEIGPPGTPRNVKNLILGQLSGMTDRTDKQVTHDTISKCITDLGLGFKISLDRRNQKHVFTMYKGRDLTDTIKFSEEFENIYDNEITFDSSKYKNYAYVYGEGEGPNRVKVEVDLTTENEERRELYVDAKDLSKGDLTDDEYRQNLITRGKEKLAEAIKEQNFNCKIKPDGVYKYKEDFNLGDLVVCESVRNKVKFKVRIMSIQQVYDITGYSLVAEIGDLKEVIL